LDTSFFELLSTICLLHPRKPKATKSNRYIIPQDMASS
jgi:hypothetical protein